MPSNPGVLRRNTRGNKTNRRKAGTPNRPQPTVPVNIVSVSSVGVGSDTLIVVFDQAVSLRGTPLWTTDVAGAVVVSATLTDPTTVSVTFDVDVSAATQLNIPYEDESVRNTSGGFIANSTVTI